MPLLDRYDAQPHRREGHGRIEDRIADLPEGGIRQTCAWDRYCAFARAPGSRKVGGDARMRVEGASEEVESDLAGAQVTLWWGLFDHELFAGFGDRRFGPYAPPRRADPAPPPSQAGQVPGPEADRHRGGGAVSVLPPTRRHRKGPDVPTAEITGRYGLARGWRAAGFSGTGTHRQIARALRGGLGSGRPIAVAGPIGVGETMVLNRPRSEITEERRIIVARSLAVDTARTTVPTLVAAPFYDLSRDEAPRIPAQGERRERELRKLVSRAGKPVALLVDGARDLHPETPNGIERPMEVTAQGGGVLSVVLARHSKLPGDGGGRLPHRRPRPRRLGRRGAALPRPAVRRMRRQGRQGRR